EDPEIPVVSLVDLGVVRDVQVDGDRVHVEFTPTFLGCPALEVMRDRMAAKLVEMGLEPDVEVVADDSWSTDRITPAGREKVRAAGPGAATPRPLPQPRAAPAARSGAPPPPRLDNLFGPTPCRSIRYCESCRQPFEQFKTI